MKRYIIISVSILFFATSCEKAFIPDSGSARATDVFDYLWQQIDRRYSMFDVKNVDWQQVYDTLRPQVRNGMKSDSLFALCSTMLNTLHDGHVNLYSAWDVSRSDSVYNRFYTDDGMDVDVLVLNYLGGNYHSTGGVAHNALCDGKVIYMRYGSFGSGVNITERHLRHIVATYPDAEGMILDIRGNGGGLTTNIVNLLSIMPSHGQLIYNSQIKAGPDHDDFTPLVPTYAPNNTGDVYNKPVLVLTDRGSFSAASTFAIATFAYDNIRLMGDTTGGGLGLPAEMALPNGWICRFSSTRTLALDGRNYENGVPPDILLKFDRENAFLHHRDNIIDSACSIILSGSLINSPKQTF